MPLGWHGDSRCMEAHLGLSVDWLVQTSVALLITRHGPRSCKAQMQDAPR